MDDHIIGCLIRQSDLEPLARRQGKARMADLIHQAEYFRRAAVHLKAADSRDQSARRAYGRGRTCVDCAYRTECQTTGDKVPARGYRHLFILACYSISAAAEGLLFTVDCSINGFYNLETSKNLPLIFPHPGAANPLSQTKR
jgi:hypothetical protein